VVFLWGFMKMKDLSKWRELYLCNIADMTHSTYT
jgi:hypothetical protein